MPKVTTPKEEIEAALILLRKKNLHRAALRLEKMSIRILRPELFKEKKTKPRRVLLRDGSGRTHPISLSFEDTDE